MNKLHAHIYSAKNNKWITDTLKLPTYLRPCSPHGAIWIGALCLPCGEKLPKCRNFDQSEPNLAANSRPTVYTIMPNFIWISLLCHLLGTKKHNFGQILTFGAPAPSPITNEGQVEIRCARADQRYMLTCQIYSRSVCSVALWRRKTPHFAIFGLQHFVVSPVGGNLSKLNTGAQLQTFPYPTVSGSFL